MARYKLIVAALVLSAACTPPVDTSLSTTQSQEGNPPYVLTYRFFLFPNVERLRAGLGMLGVVVRSTNRPAVRHASYPMKLTRLADGRSSILKTDSAGAVNVDSLPVGRYRINIQQGTPADPRQQIDFDIEPGCPMTIELYIGSQAMGIAPPPGTPLRWVITTCVPRGRPWP